MWMTCGSPSAVLIPEAQISTTALQSILQEGRVRLRERDQGHDVSEQRPRPECPTALPHLLQALAGQQARPRATRVLAAGSLWEHAAPPARGGHLEESQPSICQQPGENPSVTADSFKDDH